MSKQTKYSIRDLKKDFPTEEACLDLIFDTLHSRKCSCGGVYKKVSKRRQYQCSKCRFQIAPTSTTIFGKSDTPLSLWFHALFIFSNAKSGISAKELERQLGVTYKCAWRILDQIKKALKQDGPLLKGTVEVDTGFIGGVRRGDTASHMYTHKQPITIAIERGGNMKASLIKTTSAMEMKKFLFLNVEKGSKIMTDGGREFINRKEYKRKSVIHSKGEYVRRNVHVNTVESFIAHFKRSVAGTFKSVSKKYLQSYLDSFVWHYNNRHNDRERFGALLGALLQPSR